jgi:DNA-binding CsgD family transcriptional regulator
VDYHVRAARQATASLAFDEAAARLRTALQLEIQRSARRAEVLLELGTATHRAGKSNEALDAFAAAAEIARELDDTELLARAAIGYENACWRPGITEAGAVELLEEATSGLGDEDGSLRVGLLSGLARALDFRGDHERAAVVRQSAVEMARRIEDRAGLATLLMRAYWARGAHTPQEHLALLTEAEAIGDELGDREIVAEAMSWRVPTFVVLGDLDAARREVACMEEVAEQTAQPFVLHVAAQYRSALALCDGRLDEADALARRSHEWGRALTGRDASGAYGIQMFGIRREQGRLAELAPVMRMLAARRAGGGPWRPGLVAVLVELGMESEARRELARVRADGLGALRESLWVASLTFLADASAALGDEATAALLYPELEPLAGGSVVIGQLVACYGSADRHLGMLAATLGEWERAKEHFERATELNRRTGMVTWLGHTLLAYARARAARGDHAGAAPLLAEAAALAQRTGIPALRPPAAAPAPEPLPDGLSAREVQILALVARGLSNREIGGRLSISEHTAANHIRSILRKTGCTNRTQAATYAHRQGLVKA